MSCKSGLKRFILAYFCRYYEKRKNEACYISISVVIVAYKVCEAHLHHHSTTTPPDSRLKEQPYLNEKFFIFFYKKQGGGKYRKKLNFFFLYIFLFIIYI